MRTRRSILICALWWSGAALMLALAVGCGAPIIRHPVPEGLADQVHVPEMPAGIRAWGDQISPAFEQSIDESVRQAHAAYGDAEPTDVLAISGGGSGGAFGAGLLCGWSAAGNRPTFRVVAGTSTGAIIAPFAFLGSVYDRQLKELSTTVSDKDVFRPKGFLAALGSDSLAITTPLAHLLARYYDQPLLNAIAAEYAKGRRLFVVTTNLDAQRPVIWDLGAIASSPSPHALDLFRQVILASASIPAYFPPSYIQVVTGGKEYDEMHVDGAAIEQVCWYGDVISSAAIVRQLRPHQNGRKPQVYIIRNAKLVPEPLEVEPSLIDIADRTLSTLAKSEGLRDLERIYGAVGPEGLEFNLAYVPDDFADPSAPTIDEFDMRVMAVLFNHGYELGRAGYAWHQTPPGLQRPP